jgi:hypothetical protein
MRLAIVALFPLITHPCAPGGLSCDPNDDWPCCLQCQVGGGGMIESAHFAHVMVDLSVLTGFISLIKPM